jgi:hypothetical protein
MSDGTSEPCAELDIAPSDPVCGGCSSIVLSRIEHES